MKCRDCDIEISEGRKCGLCKICYARDYRKRNKEKIAPVAHKKYMRRREYFNEKVKEWHQNNKKKRNKKHNEYYHKNKEIQLIRRKTEYYFGNLKKKCNRCGSTERLHFHHPEPVRYDVFMVLCKDCHMLEHGKIPIKSSEKNKIPKSL